MDIITASILAAIMSTADSQLLVASSGVVRDIYQKIVAKRKSLKQKELVFLSRAVVLILVIAALFIGFVAKQLVFWLVLFARGGLWAHHSARLFFFPFSGTTKTGVITGFISGTTVTIVWN